ncbi:MAG: phosphate butyryltransferase [Synergistales bacterium]|nr:phosphate butyryltransferase [Synergistales bacterium]
MGFEHFDTFQCAASDHKRKRLAVVGPYGEDVLGAVREAAAGGLVSPLLFGEARLVREALAEIGSEPEAFPIVDAPDEKSAAAKAVQAVSSGDADVLMKGRVKTATLLKAVLNRDWGLRTGQFLSHLIMFSIKRLGRVVAVSDAGMATYPDLQNKRHIVENAAEAFRKLGVAQPHVAILSASGEVDPEASSTLDAAALAQMNRRGQIADCALTGPLSLDQAVAPPREMGPPADILVAPHIEAANMIAKVLLFLSRDTGAGVLLGARCPVVMTSRFDSAATKLSSIGLASRLNQ